jgi:hypothetical protein
MCQAKLVADNVDGAADYFGRLLRGHATEITHLDQFGQRALFPGQGINREVQIQEFHRLGGGAGFELDGCIELYLRPAAAGRRSGASMVHQNPAHCPGDHCEEVRPVGELDFRMTEKFEIGFIDEGGGLQSMLRTFLAKLRFGDPVQGVIDHADEFTARGLAAGAHLMQQLGDRRLRFGPDGDYYTLR